MGWLSVRLLGEEELTVELMQVVRVLLRRWWIIAIPVAIVSVFVVPDLLASPTGASGGFTTVVRYTAAQELDAIPNRDGDFQDVWLASELTVNAFTEWVRTNRFAEEVAAEAAARGLEINAAALNIAADNARSIGQIFLSWPDADELVTIADAAFAVLTTRSQAYFPQLGGEPANVELLDEPVIAPAPPPIIDRFEPLLRLGLAVVAGLGLALLVEYLDPTLRTRDELESMGLRVVGTLPRNGR